MSDDAHSVTIWSCFSKATVTSCARRKVDVPLVAKNSLQRDSVGKW